MIKKYSLQELVIGQQFEFRKEITRELIHFFSDYTGDFHPLHSDIVYSKQHGFNNIIAQGFLLISYISHVIGMELPGENAIILSQESSFVQPVFAGENILYQCRISDIDKRFSVINVSYSVYNASGELCVRGSVKVKIRNFIS